MKIYTLTETHDYAETNILGVYATAIRAKEACWQEAEAYPYLQNMESTEDGNSLSIRVGNKVFEVDEHEVVGA